MVVVLVEFDSCFISLNRFLFLFLICLVKRLRIFNPIGHKHIWNKKQ
jgi:hypothetical protein